MSLKEQIDYTRLPSHVAVIMDGNGRWATARGLDRSEGHVEGVNTVRRITETASEVGVKFLTLYTFSTENWNRPQAEVDALMHLIVIAIERETPDLIKNNVRLTMIGDFERMPREAYDRLQACIKDTASCTGLVLNLALANSREGLITTTVSKPAKVPATSGSAKSSKIAAKTLAFRGVVWITFINSTVVIAVTASEIALYSLSCSD